MKILMKFNEITKILYKFSKLQKYSRIIINKKFQYIFIQHNFRKVIIIFILYSHIIDFSKSMKFDDNTRDIINIINKYKQYFTQINNIDYVTHV